MTAPIFTHDWRYRLKCLTYLAAAATVVAAATIIAATGAEVTAAATAQKDEDDNDDPRAASVTTHGRTPPFIYTLSYGEAEKVLRYMKTGENRSNFLKK